MITAVLIAWVAVVLFLVLLPLAAWWFGGRRFWTRGVVSQVDELRRAVARRHSLRPVDVPRVESAVTWGRELADQRLRAAVVDWAECLMDLNRRRRAARPRMSALLGVVLVLWLVAVVTRVTLAVVQHRWGDVNWGTVAVWAVCGASAWWAHTGPRRAVRLNSDPVDA